MTDKEMIINGVDVSECEFLWKEKLPKKVCNNGNLDCDCNSNPNCYFKQLAREKEEIEELRRYHNKCCKENTEKFKHWLEKYNRLSRDFYNGKYCNKENCSLLKAKAQECEELEKMVAEAEEAPICFHCKEEPCIRQERDKYKQALDEIEEFCLIYSDNHDAYETVYKQILDIISKNEGK